MRIGECPDRVKRVHIRPARVTACVVVCIPHQFDYYAHRLAVLRLSLASLQAHTPRADYDLIVFDNGSCPEVVEFLREWQRDGHIDQLLLSRRNVGKINACRMLFEAAPGETIAYADDDVWFGAGWLEAQLRILDSFPRAGMVSGRPVRKQFAYGNTGLPAYLGEFPEVTAQTGRLIPREWEDEYLRSTGRTADEAHAKLADILLEYRGLRAYATATHFQFMAPRQVIVAAMRDHDRPRTGSEERQFEEAVEAMGYVRLSTEGRFVRHIGNVISAELLAEVTSPIAVAAADTWRPGPSWRSRLLKTRLVRAALGRINRWSYFSLNQP
jgi:glycosyltransferase involved in cell wall biosynthesis